MTRPAAPVVVVNATLAERFWGGAANAVGKRIRLDDGVCAHGGRRGRRREVLAGERGAAAVLLPAVLPGVHRRTCCCTPAGPAPVETLLDQARARVAALDADLPISSARPFTENIKGALLFYELAAAMLFVFGAAGMALAGLGTYGLVSHTVKQSTHEIGIRMALGASGPVGAARLPRPGPPARRDRRGGRRRRRARRRPAARARAVRRQRRPTRCRSRARWRSCWPA